MFEIESLTPAQINHRLITMKTVFKILGGVFEAHALISLITMAVIYDVNTYETKEIRRILWPLQEMVLFEILLPFQEMMQICSIVELLGMLWIGLLTWALCREIKWVIYLCLVFSLLASFNIEALLIGFLLLYYLLLVRRKEELAATPYQATLPTDATAPAFYHLPLA